MTPAAKYTLRSKPLKPDSIFSDTGAEGIFWWTGPHGFNAFGATIFYTKAAALAFMASLEGKDGAP